MSQNRQQVLEMLSAGTITAIEADRLIGALEGPSTATTAIDRAPSGPRATPRYLRVLVDADEENEGPVKVNIRVPLQLLRAGVRLASLIPAQAQEEVNAALSERGFPFDVTQIKPENLNELIDGLTELTVDIAGEKDNVRVQVFCE